MARERIVSIFLSYAFKPRQGAYDRREICEAPSDPPKRS